MCRNANTASMWVATNHSSASYDPPIQNHLYTHLTFAYERLTDVTFVNRYIVPHVAIWLQVVAVIMGVWCVACGDRRVRNDG